MKKPIQVICLALLVTGCLALFAGCGGKSTRSCGGGELIAFLSDRSGNHYMLWTMRSDGTDQKMLEGAWAMRTIGRDPVISPGGERIAFSQGNRSQGWALIVNADGSEPDTIVPETPFSYVYPGDWSPDGGKLVYHTNKLKVFACQLYFCF